MAKDEKAGEVQGPFPGSMPVQFGTAPAPFEEKEPYSDVSLRHARIYRGVAYGPGKIRIPTRVADALAAEDEEAGRSATQSGAPAKSRKRTGE